MGLLRRCLSVAVLFSPTSTTAWVSTTSRSTTNRIHTFSSTALHSTKEQQQSSVTSQISNDNHKAATNNNNNNACVATFGMGCFWAPSERLAQIPGVTRAVVGYTGCTPAQNPVDQIPNYESVCYSNSRPWVEGVRVEYNPQEISYPELLDAFYQAQEPRMGSRQYGSVIFAHNAAQRQAAEEWQQQQQQQQSSSSAASAGTERDDGFLREWTAIEPATPFYQAETYHQDYWAKNRIRIAGVVFLLATASGAWDGILPSEVGEPVHSGANALALLGMVWALVERQLDKGSVVLLPDGKY